MYRHMLYWTHLSRAVREFSTLPATNFSPPLFGLLGDGDCSPLCLEQALPLAVHCRTQTLTFMQVRLADGVPRARARQATTTPAILAPRVVQHEQLFQAPQDRTAARVHPHFALLSALHLAAHQARPSRTRSDARLYLALLFPRPQWRRLWHLRRRCRPSLNPFRTGKPPLLSRRRTSTSSAPSAVGTSPHPRAFDGPHFCVPIRLQHFFRGEGPIRLHWRVFAIDVLIRASELELERWIPRLLDPGTRTHLQRQPHKPLLTQHIFAHTCFISFLKNARGNSVPYRPLYFGLTGYLGNVSGLLSNPSMEISCGAEETGGPYAPHFALAAGPTAWGVCSPQEPAAPADGSTIECGPVLRSRVAQKPAGSIASTDSPARSRNGVGRKEPERTHTQDRGSDGRTHTQEERAPTPRLPRALRRTLAGAGGAIEGKTQGLASGAGAWWE
ncbi:hypothetical protein B0H14DRAFT_2623202 [Mycena olivaceomarginata]|nr:hypothetical protein B0H14DRAFT_2623202 [Mycena olivaceomarginata]